MYIFYLDESGTATYHDSEDRYFFLGGIAIHDSKWMKLRGQIELIIKDNPINDKIISEIKTSDLTYKSENLRNDMATNILNKIYELLSDRDINLFPFAVIIDKNEMISKYAEPADPYELSYIFLFERFQFLLQEKNEIGVISCDRRKGGLECAIVRLHDSIMKREMPFTSINPTQILESVMYHDSRLSKCGQLADVVIHAVKRKYTVTIASHMVNKRYQFITSHMIRGNNNKLSGYGIKAFPDNVQIFEE
jgi:hypothetical protein